MATLRKCQLHNILTKWCHQILSSRLFNYSTNTQMTNNTSSDQNPNPYPGSDNDFNEGPILPSAEACCGEGCASCVWLMYVIEVKFHYKHNEKNVQEAIRCIPNPSVKAFVKMELKKKVAEELKPECENS